MTDVLRFPGTDRTVQEYVSGVAAEMALLQGAAEVGSVSVTRAAGDLAGKWFVEVDAYRPDDTPIRFSGFGEIQDHGDAGRGVLVKLSEVPASDPFDI